MEGRKEGWKLSVFMVDIHLFFSRFIFLEFSFLVGILSSTLLSSHVLVPPLPFFFPLLFFPVTLYCFPIQFLDAFNPHFLLLFGKKFRPVSLCLAMKWDGYFHRAKFWWDHVRQHGREYYVCVVCVVMWECQHVVHWTVGPYLRVLVSNARWATSSSDPRSVPWQIHAHPRPPSFPPPPGLLPPWHFDIAYSSCTLAFRFVDLCRILRPLTASLRVKDESSYCPQAPKELIFSFRPNSWG